MYLQALFLSIFSFTTLSFAFAENSERLKPCPNSPNCVNSLHPQGNSKIEPIYSKDTRKTLKKLEMILENLARSKKITIEEGYLHFQIRSFLFGFIDDVECQAFPQEGIIHIKSAAKSGYYDFNVNKNRVKKIKQALEKLEENSQD